MVDNWEPMQDSLLAEPANQAVVSPTDAKGTSLTFTDLSCPSMLNHSSPTSIPASSRALRNGSARLRAYTAVM